MENYIHPWPGDLQLTVPDSSAANMVTDDDIPPTEEPGGGDINQVKTISDLLLGVVNWWCLKFGHNEVVNLVMRHFEHAQVYNSCLTLAKSCDLPKPIYHRSTAARPALEPCSNDLVKS